MRYLLDQRLFLKLPEVNGKTPCSKAAQNPLQTQLSLLLQQCWEAQLAEVTSEMHFYKPHSKRPAQPYLNALYRVCAGRAGASTQHIICCNSNFPKPTQNVSLRARKVWKRKGILAVAWKGNCRITEYGFHCHCILTSQASLSKSINTGLKQITQWGFLDSVLHDCTVASS